MTRTRLQAGNGVTKITHIFLTPATGHNTVESAYNEGIGGKKRIRNMQTFVICGKL